MKRDNTIIAIILLVVMAGCRGNKQSTDDFITVDVTKSYPKKELILQDFMDVEYIPLETNDEFVTQSHVQAIGKTVIIVRNRNRDGDIFIFDRTTGAGIKKINRRGQGPEEYGTVQTMYLDEDKNEMFVNDAYDSRKFLIYDFDGNYKRCIEFKEGYMYEFFYAYDSDNLISNDYKFSMDSEKKSESFFILSKQDGSIVKHIEIPIKQQKLAQVRVGNMSASFLFFPVIRQSGNWILTSSSSDTIFRYLPDHTMTPFIVRTPFIHSMNPEEFLFPGVLTDRYYFTVSIKKEFMPEAEADDYWPLPRNLMYDNQEKRIYEYTVYNNDFNKRIVDMYKRPVNEEIAFWDILEAYELVEAYEKGEIKDGKLKEIASKMDAEDNPVIMIARHKK